MLLADISSQHKKIPSAKNVMQTTINQVTKLTVPLNPEKSMNRFLHLFGGGPVRTFSEYKILHVKVIVSDNRHTEVGASESLIGHVAIYTLTYKPA